MIDGSHHAPSIDMRLVLSEPLRVRRLAEFFGVESHKMRKILDAIPGAKKLDGFWRVPVQSMPPTYLLSRGLIRPTDFQKQL